MSLLQISYDDIFDSFLGSVTDYSLASLDKSDAYGFMTGWLRKGLGKPYVKRIFSTSVFDDVSQTFTFQLRRPAVGETDEDQLEFVRNIAAMAMVVEWCAPQVMKTTNMTQLFATKEQKFYSQKEMLAELQELLKNTRHELRQELCDRGVVNNPYLGTVETDDA